MSIYKKLIRPVLFRMPSETAHEIGLGVLKLGLTSLVTGPKPDWKEFGEIERFGLKFRAPFGLAAGFDKNAIAANQLESLGFGFIEVGTVTYHAQPGNPKPRLFRLPQDKALINRAGFNNEGTAAAVERLKKKRPSCVLGVNIGKSKIVPNEEATEDYLRSFDLAHTVADYIAVNVSSPNTPNLRELQKADALEELLLALQGRNQELSAKPLLVKIAPDLTEPEIESIVDICMRLELSGIIATNTTITRDGLTASRDEIEKIGAGGLSGRPLTQSSTEVISKIHKYSNGKLPIIGVGGIFTAEDAFDKVRAGACLLQGYTGFVYQGFSYAHDINSGLAGLLKQHGFKNLDEAVGTR